MNSAGIKIKKISSYTSIILIILIFLLSNIYYTAYGQTERHVYLDATPVYRENIEIRPNEVVYIYIHVTRYDRVDVRLAPTAGPFTLVVRKPTDGGGPGGPIYDSRDISKETTISIQIVEKGVWTLELSSTTSQKIYVEITAQKLPSPQQAPSQEFLPSNLLYIAIGAVIVSSIIIIAIVAIATMRRGPKIPVQPSPQMPPPSPPQTQVPQTITTQPTRTTSTETVVMTERPVHGETEIVLAALELPSGDVVPIVSPRQIFGRVDFEKYLKPEQTQFISRRHFMIILDSSGFSIEDLGSANGTFVNGVDIRGKGKIPLKSGDEINVAGVLRLKFKTLT